MKILVLGCGWLGGRLVRDLSGARGPIDVDITDRNLIGRFIEHEHPDAVINAAGKTGRPNSDWCETHREETYRSNVVGARNVAEACAKQGVYLLHLGDGHIFNGPSPTATPLFDSGWRETDFANPQSFYTQTKYNADCLLEKRPNVAVVRLQMPIDDTPHPRNLITKLASYSQVIDVKNSVTVVRDLVLVISQLIEKRAGGIFHAVNQGTMRHRGLMVQYREIVDSTHNYEIVAPEALHTVAPRSNAILADTRLKELGIVMRPAGEAIREALVNYAQAIGKLP